jgi:aminopeptidase N
MPTHHGICARICLATAVLVAATSMAMVAPPEESGVSRALAIARAARLSGVRYQLSFTVKEHESAVAGTETLSFESKSAGGLPIDYRDGSIQSATLNGHAIPIMLENGHLNLPVVAGRNTLTVAFTSNAASAGKAITRYEDKDDGSEYFYTLFVPMDASMAFPCFDQPDLKAMFVLDVEHPATWSVISNTATVTVRDTHSQFAESRPISTYLFAFAAGPFATVRSQNPSEPTIYVRKSQLARARQETTQVQGMAARGIVYFSEYFSQPFPFPKYDLVLIPGFPFGGMEHAGATFLDEDSVLFRSTPTASDYFHRDILLLHETCHQWFGDLVTMRWFDDLWLKEGFAQYMAYKAMAQLEPKSNPWKRFYEDIKPQAYGIDETQGTTPIFQSIPNLKDAKSAYGAIVYRKAPAVLNQLHYRLGDEDFRDGLRLYLKDHAYSNAEWADLIRAFELASAQAGHRKDVQSWADAWILRRGMPQVEARWRCEKGRIADFTLHQEDVLKQGYIWPMSNEVLAEMPSEPGHAPHPPLTLRVDWSDANHVVTEAIGQECPAYVFTNFNDDAYGRFLLDSASQAAMKASVPGHDPLLHVMLWGALWDDVRLAKFRPRSFLNLALSNLANEQSDEAFVRIQGARMIKALHSYVPAATRSELAPHVEAVFADAMRRNPDLGLRIVNFRAFNSVAETPEALQQVKDLLTGKLAVPGLTLKPLDRWNLIGQLFAMNDADAPAIYAAEKSRDHSAEGKKYAYAVEAGTATAETKARYFEDYLHSQTIQEDWITQSLRPFNSWNQAALSQPYLTKALNALPEVKQHRKIFFLSAWLAAFIEGQNTLQSSQEAQFTVHAWLASQKIDADLRLKVLEFADSLDRTVLIRQTFPH